VITSIKVLGEWEKIRSSLFSGITRLFSPKTEVAVDVYGDEVYARCVPVEAEWNWQSKSEPV